jgi:TPR repeat protein
MHRFYTIIISASLIAALASCTSIAIKGVATASEQATIARYQNAADEGNAEAQYNVGAAHCCRIGKTDIAHDNQKATEYLCRSAKQNYSKAQYVLGRIYAGHPIVGFNPQQSIKLKAVGSEKNISLAVMWLTLAAAGRDDDANDAREALKEIERSATPQDQAQAKKWLDIWQHAPCKWSEVFPSL